MGEMGLINRFDEYYLSQGANFTQCIITKTLRENNFETFQILEEAPKSKKNLKFRSHTILNLQTVVVVIVE